MKKLFSTWMFAAIALALAGCQTAPPSAEGKQSLMDDAHTTLRTLDAVDPGLKDFLHQSYGYVIFPHAGKGGLIAGGAYGRGVVHEQGHFAGYADISQATIGAQAGGQSFTEIIAFETQKDLDRFKAGKFTFAANASAVLMKSGAAKSARYTDGVAVFVKPEAGAMGEAVVGGQSFSYQPAAATEK